MISLVSVQIPHRAPPGGRRTSDRTAPVLANLVIEDTVERIYHQDVFAEMWRGLFLIRGENVVLLGEIVRRPDSLHSAYAERLLLDRTLIKKMKCPCVR